MSENRYWPIQKLLPFLSWFSFCPFYHLCPSCWTRHRLRFSLSSVSASSSSRPYRPGPFYLKYRKKKTMTVWYLCRPVALNPSLTTGCSELFRAALSSTPPYLNPYTLLPSNSQVRGRMAQWLEYSSRSPGSPPGVDAICGLSLLLDLSFAPSAFLSGSPLLIGWFSNRTGTSVDDGARKSNNWLDQWLSGKLGTGSRVQSFPRAFPSSNDAPVLLLNRPNNSKALRG